MLKERQIHAARAVIHGIAAEGAFDPEAHIRLRRFLASLKQQHLPIYFHSMGGMIQASVEVGKILRERRMTAGVGQTIPDECRVAPKADESCRRLMQSGRELKTRLRFEGATCASGCVYAFLGATERLVPPGARLGVHASRSILPSSIAQGGSKREHAQRVQAALNLQYARLGSYMVSMGVDGALIETARKVPPHKVYWLSRDEMSRFGIVANSSAMQALSVQRALDAVTKSTGYSILQSSTSNRGQSGTTPAIVGETQWNFSQGPLDTINKWMMRPSTSSRGELRATSIKISCHSAGNALVSVRRELVPEEHYGVSSTTRILSSGNVLWLSQDMHLVGDDTRTKTVAMDSLKQAALDGLEIEEVFTQLNGQRPSWTRKAPLSVNGLAEALDRLAPLCLD